MSRRDAMFNYKLPLRCTLPAWYIFRSCNLWGSKTLRLSSSHAVISFVFFTHRYQRIIRNRNLLGFNPSSRFHIRTIEWKWYKFYSLIKPISRNRESICSMCFGKKCISFENCSIFLLLFFLTVDLRLFIWIEYDEHNIIITIQYLSLYSVALSVPRTNWRWGHNANLTIYSLMVYFTVLYILAFSSLEELV